MLIDFIIWRGLGEGVLGLYGLGRRVPTGIASMLYSIVLRVTYPLMARQQDDQRKLNQMYLKTVTMLAVVVLPPAAVIVNPINRGGAGPRCELGTRWRCAARRRS